MPDKDNILTGQMLIEQRLITPEQLDAGSYFYCRHV
jgi:hypothetical protein